MSRRKPPSAFAGSLKIASVAGIPIRLHWTFILFMAWILYLGQNEQFRMLAWLLPAIFLCVVLHELGHALTAKRYGIKTRDITLYPIGGVAMLHGRPKASQEIWIALAGPAVNVAIALFLVPVIYAVEGELPPVGISLENRSFLQGLFIANVALPLFNMLPAFPMDGGRVLRGILSLKMPEMRATRIAGAVGQGMAITLGFVGIFTNYFFLIIIAFFVFWGAGQEISASLGFSLVSGRRIADAMMTQFRVVGSGESLGKASQMLLESAQQDFPVVWGVEVLGLLAREDIVRGLATEGPEAYTAGHMKREYKRLAPSDPLEKALESFTQQDRSPVLVMEGDSLVGMVTAENLAEFMMLEQARGR